MARRQSRGGGRKQQVDVQGVVQIHWVTNGPQRGWAHTHGLVARGLPELEIVGVPSYFMTAAARLLNQVASYMLTEKVVRAGEVMLVGEQDWVRFEVAAPTPGEQPHFGGPALRIVEVAHVPCAGCESASRH